MNALHRTILLFHLTLSACSSGAAAFISLSSLSQFTFRPQAAADAIGAALFALSNNNGVDDERNHTHTSTIQQLTRRRWLSCMSSASTTSILLAQSIANAAPPLTAEEADNTSARFERALRPKPPKVLRPRMNLDFAVLLMRSSYNAVDTIDIVAMDQFQRDFFLIRQAEYQPYANALGPGAMQQGDLADPNYFDFISFAQYSTINREINNPPAVFEEQQPVEVGEGEPQQFVSVVVKRDPTLSNKDLPVKHAEIVGDAILDTLLEKFGGTASAIPKIESSSRPDVDTLFASIKQVVNLFVVSGFAWDGNASIVQSGKSGTDASETQFAITFTSPATLWSGQSLKAKNAVLMNDFALKTAKALIQRAGYRVNNVSVKYKNNQEISTFTVV